ncbi:hypothetical protein JDT86_23700 [Escherichia coli]|nr:hypothetical protein [Escherichia coli]HBH7370873.1 hypothetical protein [Escherichia coli]HBI0293654.1 hypothetical protein [Escherichia coli]HDV4009066.1 hypothetical protein [Escherichia coli]
MNLLQDGIKLHRGNFTAIGQQIQPYLEDGKCFRMVLKPWRERRSLSQNALIGAHTHSVAIGSHGHTITVNAAGNAENTVKNIAFNYIVRLA